MRKLIFLLSFLLSALYANAIGEWHVFPYSLNFSRGELFAGKYYLLSGNELLSVKEGETDNIEYYNRLTGLNGTNVFDIIYSEAANRLVIVYSDGNIDFIDVDGSITNLPDYANKVIVGDRTILGISERDGNLYISTGFGFMIVNIAKAEFEDTYNYDISEYKDGTYGKRTSTVSAQLLKELNETIKVNGVGGGPNASLDFKNGYLLTSNVETSRDALYSLNGIISKYDSYEYLWENIYRKDVDPQTDGTTYLKGITSVALDPKDSQHYFVGTFALGIFEFYGESLKQALSSFNSTDIESILGPTHHTNRIGDIKFDDNGYVWFTNVAVENPLRCFTPAGNVLKFPLNGYQILTGDLDKLMISKNDPYKFKWIWGARKWNEGQIAMFYDGGTPEDTSDDESKTFTSLIDQDGNVIIPNFFSDIAEDKNGAVWILTSSGPFVVDSPIETYKNPGKVRRVKIPRNDGTNLADYLLANVDCSCIVVDAANRKWIGTNDAGLYLISADGLQQLEHFTTENSPLQSNNILALAYDDVSGTIYISCDGGLLSYTTDATRGADNYNNVICYPNPVRPEYTGNLHITGLKDKTKVRICDITNTVIYSTVCEGGSITWNLCNSSGDRVKAGVYIVYGTDSDGNSGKVTKFLVVN